MSICQEEGSVTELEAMLNDLNIPGMLYTQAMTKVTKKKVEVIPKRDLTDTYINQ